MSFNAFGTNKFYYKWPQQICNTYNFRNTYHSRSIPWLLQKLSIYFRHNYFSFQVASSPFTTNKNNYKTPFPAAHGVNKQFLCQSIRKYQEFYKGQSLKRLRENIFSCYFISVVIWYFLWKMARRPLSDSEVMPRVKKKSESVFGDESAEVSDCPSDILNCLNPLV